MVLLPWPVAVTLFSCLCFLPSPPPTHVPHTEPCIHLLGAAVLQLGQNGDINVFLWFFLGKSLREKKEQDARLYSYPALPVFPMRLSTVPDPTPGLGTFS